MDVGLALPQYDFSVAGENPLRWETLRRYAVEAEAAGFGSLWLADHLPWSIAKYGAAAGEWDGFDPIVALGGLAAVTSTVRLGALVFCVPLRPAPLLAKAIATLDALSGGRLDVGLGAGWYEPEFARAEVTFEPFTSRMGHLAEAIEALRCMARGGPCNVAGRHVTTVDALCLPPTLQQPSPPIWVGGRSDRVLDVVARHADGWNSVWRATPEQWSSRARALDEACDRAGRDPVTVRRSVGLFTLVGENDADLASRYRALRATSPPGVLDRPLVEWRHGALVGTPASVAEQLEEWQALGVDTLICNLGAVPFAAGGPDDAVGVTAAACTLAG